MNFSTAIGFGTGTPFSGTSGSLSIFSTDVGAPTFLAGNPYNVDIRFISGIGYQPDIGVAIGQGAGTAQAASFYDSQPSFSITAVPEPATYAAWAGVLALGLAAWRRKRSV